MDYVNIILVSFYFMLPAYFANMAPILFRKRLTFLAKPLDFGITIKGKRLFGENKTFRGLIVGIIFALIVSFIQYNLNDHGFFYSIYFITYLGWFQFGFLMGFGALMGDAIESFFKRQLNIAPGKPFIPFDQTDFCVGALVAVYFFGPFDLKYFFMAIFITFFLHIIVNHSAYFLKIREERW